MSIYVTVLKSDHALSDFTPEVTTTVTRYHPWLTKPEYPTARFLAEDYVTFELDVDPWTSGPNGKTYGEPDLYADLRDRGIDVLTDDQRIPPLFGSVGYLNLLVQAAPALTGALGAVLGAWLQQRGNHKVRRKLGDKEFEARSSEELEQLIDMGLRFQKSERSEEKRGVSELAYELWVRRGSLENSSDEDWLRAEELLAKFGK